MARNSYNDFDFETQDDDRLLLDMDDLDQDEADCLAALSVHDERFGRDLHDEY